MSNLEEKLKDENATKEAVESALSELESASMELGKVVYEAAAAESASAEPAEDGSTVEGDVIDGEASSNDK